MPDIASHLSREERDYVPGYDWIKDRYGPPPGIQRAIKESYDRMSDKQFMEALLRHSKPEQMSLMIAEDDRRRTYQTQWKHLKHLPYENLAREGFYYTGVSDRVQCAFCLEVLGNWVKGDEPAMRHKRLSPNCRMVTKHPCGNLPRDREPSPPQPAPHPSPPALLDYTKYDSYLVMKQMGRSAEVLHCIFQRNRNRDFSDVQVLLTAVLAFEEGDEAKIAEVLKKEQLYWSGGGIGEKTKAGSKDGPGSPSPKQWKSED